MKDDRDIATILWQAAKNVRPTTPDALHDYIRNTLDIRIARVPVCAGHSAPFEPTSNQFFHRPELSLIHGPRGGGKSLTSAIGTHLDSRFTSHHATKILAGSKAQASQIYEALKSRVFDFGEERNTLAGVPLKESAKYKNGSEVSIIAASAKSVHGPHVQTLKLDEVDEMDPGLRESAMGMCMRLRGIEGSVLMTSTWHRDGGPMGDLMAKGRDGAFPVYSFCIFEVLERCPESRSGRYVGGDAGFEHCPECPIKIHCHADRSSRRDDLPKAKRSDGHYSITSLIQKARAISLRAFRSDFTCEEPSSAGIWFPDFGAENISESAEWKPHLPVDLAVDTGVRTGAVWFQKVDIQSATGPIEEIHVFADYYSDGPTAGENADAILAITNDRCQGRTDRRSTDPAGSARNPIGPTVLEEYRKRGLRLDHWRKGRVLDGIELLRGFIKTGTGQTALKVHPRCKALIAAMKAYRRKKISGVFVDAPEDEQHPEEDMVDALRCGVYNRYPEGRRVKSSNAIGVRPGFFRG